MSKKSPPSGDVDIPGTEAWLEDVREIYGPMLKCDGYDDCIMGVTTQFNTTTILYDQDKMIHKLAREFMRANRKLSKSRAYDDANEHFQFNIIGAWMGKETPSFFSKK